MVAHFTQAPDEPGNGRFHYLANLLSKNAENNVKLITTSFSHKYKRQRDIKKLLLDSLNYDFEIIYEPGYKKNVSIKRFYSHYILGRDLKKYLALRRKPDVIYCAVPSLDAAYAAAKYAKKNKVRFIIDVQDIWPEAFKMVFSVPIISDILFYPMKSKADYVYRAADEIIAVSQTYVNRALNVNKKCKKAQSIFLGTELAHFDALAEENKLTAKPENEVWMAYIGTLGHSYDLTCVIGALKILKCRGISNIKFVVMGDGPLKAKFERYAKEQEIYVEFMGRLDYGKMAGILAACDIAVNPIAHGAAGSIINKVGDYAAAGLPVINTQECNEYRDLVSKYNIGLNCINGDMDDFASKLQYLYSNKEARLLMGRNNRKLAEAKFDRRLTYSKIIEIIEKDL